MLGDSWKRNHEVLCLAFDTVSPNKSNNRLVKVGDEDTRATCLKMVNIQPVDAHARELLKFVTHFKNKHKQFAIDPET